ncbi:hypothetical protein NL526_27545, partial [Klebsiella pneumoniae]|nr:hypothetical protein [Klebsiella pneumoniae]
YLPLDSVTNPPFTIPAGGFLAQIFKEGDYGWTAVSANGSSAQGGVTLQRAQDVQLTLGQ